MINFFRLNLPERYPQYMEDSAVTKIFAADTTPILAIFTSKSAAILENSGGNRPIIILSKAASAINTKMV
jgi:hypothetical protein